MEAEKEQIIDKQPVLDILESMGEVAYSDLIPILQKIQEVYGYLPPKILGIVAKQTKISAARIYGVATFYEQFHLEPHGRHTIKCCRGTACHVRKGPEIIEEIEKQLDVKAGGTTQDMRFTFETVACLGTCFLAPVIMINNDYYGHLSTTQIKEILNKYE